VTSEAFERLLAPAAPPVSVRVPPPSRPHLPPPPEGKLETNPMPWAPMAPPTSERNGSVPDAAEREAERDPDARIVAPALKSQAALGAIIEKEMHANADKGPKGIRVPRWVVFASVGALGAAIAQMALCTAVRRSTSHASASASSSTASAAVAASTTDAAKGAPSAATAPPPPTPLPGSAGTAPGTAAGKPFNRTAAITSLRKIGGSFPACRDATRLWGSGQATISFAPDGSVSSVVVGPPFAKTLAGDCVADKLRAAQAPPYDGKPGVVVYRFVIPKK
jgi:hypothetical protein